MAKKNEQVARRQEIRARLAERRRNEERLVEAAADAIGDKAAAVEAAAAADDRLAEVVEELKSIGMTAEELAEVLAVPAAQLKVRSRRAVKEVPAPPARRGVNIPPPAHIPNTSPVSEDVDLADSSPAAAVG